MFHSTIRGTQQLEYAKLRYTKSGESIYTIT